MQKMFQFYDVIVTQTIYDKQNQHTIAFVYISVDASWLIFVA